MKLLIHLFIFSILVHLNTGYFYISTGYSEASAASAAYIDSSSATSSADASQGTGTEVTEVSEEVTITNNFNQTLIGNITCVDIVVDIRKGGVLVYIPCGEITITGDYSTSSGPQTCKEYHGGLYSEYDIQSDSTTRGCIIVAMGRQIDTVAYIENDWDKNVTVSITCQKIEYRTGNMFTFTPCAEMNVQGEFRDNGSPFYCDPNYNGEPEPLLFITENGNNGCEID